ncbi:hypothetical protein ACFQS7_24740 [Dankookia sp. GCM10030260]|uniref:hypothetical protein n=1 Tax=Dankookia sp. GCM10030260 TaxID=3273390 RepID=UPI003613A91A
MTRGTATLAAMMAVIPLLGGCAEPYPAAASAGDVLPFLGPPPRVREPSSSRPVWLLPQPAKPERFRVPDDGFMDQLG